METWHRCPKGQKLVEEFMLLANMAVAHQIYRSFPKKALLRRHPPPQTKMLNDLMEFCSQMGLEIDCSNAGTLHKSLNEIFGTDRYAEARKEVLTNMFSRPMQALLGRCEKASLLLALDVKQKRKAIAN
ncbi:hypothetical protein JD844_007923 [Phrynosoma platyrhinos]|uniref:RNB domain-containing protein n=1 Tax=Phrynosoma platyrhinos TaxID=52577 RepID=A0ABQ7T473_PHRPL|nr:hypothetical protein JD844_007923 [Phrynosoma platyrhinos]